MALDVYETQEGTYAGTCCRRTMSENEHAPWISPAASTCFEGGRPSSVYSANQEASDPPT